MKLKELKEECKNKKVTASIYGNPCKHAKQINLVVNQLNKRDWYDFSWGEQQILIAHFDFLRFG